MAYHNSARLTSVTKFHDDILNDLHATQRELHAWGCEKLVVFNEYKKSLHTLHRRFPDGEDLEILGVVYDIKLLMHSAARVIAIEAGWGLRTLLQARHYFSMIELFRLYKS